MPGAIRDMQRLLNWESWASLKNYLVGWDYSIEQYKIAANLNLITIACDQ